MCDSTNILAMGVWDASVSEVPYFQSTLLGSRRVKLQLDHIVITSHCDYLKTCCA